MGGINRAFNVIFKYVIMELRNYVTNIKGKEIPASEILVEIKPDGSTDNQVKCICMMCRSAYTERPLICRCASNVFLKNVENGQVIN